MIVAKIILGNDFQGLMNYILSSKKDIPSGHISTRNIINRRQAALEMQAVSSQNSRVIDPVCHLILSWAAYENPSAEQQLKAGYKVCKALKLDTHQLVLAVHSEPKNGITPGPDGRHFEMHIVSNRVHPNGRVNKLFNSYKIAEIAAAQISKEMEFSVVPGRYNKVEGLNKPGLNPKIGSIRTQTGRLTIAEEIRANPEIINALLKARKTDWQTFVEAFKKHGIDICVARQAHGKISGLSMVDIQNPDRKIALSNLENGIDNIKWGFGALVKDFGPINDKLRSKLFKEFNIYERKTSDLKRPIIQKYYTEKTIKTDSPAFTLFKKEQENAMKLRQIQLNEIRILRENIYRKAAVKRDRRYAFKSLRQRLLRQFFGRNSLCALAINAYCDFDYTRDLKSIMVSRTRKLAVLKAKSETNAIQIPTWVSWQRANAKRSSLQQSALANITANNTKVFSDIQQAQVQNMNPTLPQAAQIITQIPKVESEQSQHASFLRLGTQIARPIVAIRKSEVTANTFDAVDIAIEKVKKYIARSPLKTLGVRASSDALRFQLERNEHKATGQQISISDSLALKNNTSPTSGKQFTRSSSKIRDSSANWEK